VSWRATLELKPAGAPLKIMLTPESVAQ